MQTFPSFQSIYLQNPLSGIENSINQKAWWLPCWKEMFCCTEVHTSKLCFFQVILFLWDIIFYDIFTIWHLLTSNDFWPPTKTRGVLLYNLGGPHATYDIPHCRYKVFIVELFWPFANKKWTTATFQVWKGFMILNLRYVSVFELCWPQIISEIDQEQNGP